ncbi:radical SAM protein [Tissierella carlieri]|uniref:Radical SAM protein n=2 Tax=Tissierella carlieri TaxID=689904 RepID=A0ABT1SGW2_9FIRM|nr:radical SAM protein [Tissierella carlieri]
MEILKYNHNKKKFSRDTLNVTIKLTNDCNFRCVYCYQEHEKKYLSAENAKTIIEFFKKQLNLGYNFIDVHWFGGEPLLNENPLFEIEEFLVREKIKGTSDITTNGYTIDEDLILKLKSTRISSLQLTLDGDKEFHDSTRILASGKGSFDDTINKIKLLTSNELEVYVRINLNKKNQKLDSLLDRLNRLNIKNDLLHIYVNETTNFELSQKIDNFYFSDLKEYADSYLDVQKTFLNKRMKFPRPALVDTGCAFNCDNSFLIETDLKLYFCTSSENNDSFEQGEILRSGDIKLNYENYCKRVNYSHFDDEKCVKCKLLPICMGGCSLKRIMKKEPCIPEKYNIEEYIKLLYKEELGNV